MERLIKIQTNLKAPKNQFNKFGGYNYRSCEDILNAVKPYLEELKLALVISDDLTQIGDRYYIKATAQLFTEEGQLLARTTAFAREEENKKGMDGSQVTGACSSYARKYALNALFAIDDVKDSDFTNTHEKETKTTKKTDKKPNSVDDYNNEIDKQLEEEQNKLYCSNCGEEIAKNIHGFSMVKYGKPLCVKCQKNNKRIA